MHDRNNHDCRVLYPKIDAERKALNHSASGIPMNIRIHRRGFCDASEHRQHLIEELVPQTLPLLLVPRCRVRQVLFCFRPESDRKRHNLRRISVIASIAGRPGFPSVS